VAPVSASTSIRVIEASKLLAANASTLMSADARHAHPGGLDNSATTQDRAYPAPL